MSDLLGLGAAGVRALHALDRIFQIIIAGAVEADDDAIADQLVRPDAREIAQILDPFGRGGRGDKTE